VPVKTKWTNQEIGALLHRIGDILELEGEGVFKVIAYRRAADSIGIPQTGDVIDDEVSAPIAAHLARLARRHLPLFVAIRNSDLFAAASAPASDRLSAVHRAAAVELVLQQAKALGEAWM
jgi:hypothetical protein